jgi:hypothetical protein
MNYYMWRQNNTGGSFVTDDDLSRFVVIQADSYADAEQKAFSFGIYYDGVDSGYDCECCGDRWREGKLVELDEGDSIEDYLQREEDEYPFPGTMTILHLADWSKKTFKGRT